MEILEQWIWRFLWNQHVEKGVMHLINWKKVTQPKQNGGLGVRLLRETNLALLAKLKLRFLKQKDEFWGKLLQGKYGFKRDVQHRNKECHIVDLV